jgi:hypothetical protein
MPADWRKAGVFGQGVPVIGHNFRVVDVAKMCAQAFGNRQGKRCHAPILRSFAGSKKVRGACRDFERDNPVHRHRVRLLSGGQ